MILRDKITIYTGKTDGTVQTAPGAVLETVKAHVGTSSSGEEITLGTGVYIRSLVEETRALIKPNPRAVADRVYSWDGRYYRQVGDPLIRRKHGRDHHYTIKLERVSTVA